MTKAEFAMELIKLVRKYSRDNDCCVTDVKFSFTSMGDPLNPHHRIDKLEIKTN